jgi:hypothetical protein
MNRTRQSFVFAQLSQKTERESVKALLNDALHERLLLDTENTYVTVSSSSVSFRTCSMFSVIVRRTSC